MFKFIHQLFNPHCQHCAEERKERAEIERQSYLERRNEIKDDTICLSCETLRNQLEIRNHEYNLLLDKLINKPAPEVVVNKPVEMSVPRNVPWRVRQQELELADRLRAQTERTAPKPIPIPDGVDLPSTDELEKDVIGGRG